MFVAETRTRIVPFGEHLDALHALAFEIDRAMQAIVRNDLAELEDSIAAQQSLCQQLSNSSQQIARCSRLQAGSAESLDPEIRHQIDAATGELKKLNQRYSTLLKYSSRSAEMMTLLFISYRGQIKEASGQGQKNENRSDRMDSQWEA